ncbi:MAG: hypothetical protein Q7U96_01805, partial [Chloroflexota bacterium]|nr:hypothetical protein [Chloroflexota bacterium]
MARYDGNSSTVSLADPDLEGWIWKRGHLVKNWKIRWAVLKDKTLYYFKDQKNTGTPLGLVAL